MSVDDDTFYRDEIYEQTGTNVDIGNLLIIDRLEIIKTYRGHGLGSEAIKRIERLFGAGANLVALKAFPLQHEKSNIKRSKSWVRKMGFNTLNQDLSLSNILLIKYYKSIGFYKLGEDTIMLKSIN